MENQLRPFITINVAMTVDGKIDTFERQGALISSPADKIRIDRLRSEVDAVLVGGRTLLDEDPKLTVKSPEFRANRKARGLPENPAKVGIVSIASLDPKGSFFASGPARKLIYTSSRTSQDEIEVLREHGAEVYIFGEARVDLKATLSHLSTLGVRKLMVEGGGTLIARLLELGLADEIFVYIAPLIFAGSNSPTLAEGPGWSRLEAVNLDLISVDRLDEGGIVIHYSVRN